jgi:SAM-dependent methyltransferase
MADRGYVHGYTDRERTRLDDQARTLTDLLHHDTAYPAGSRVLELGCGVGAQTVILARNSPGAEITSVDISPVSIAAARAAVDREGFANVTFQAADIFHLPFPEGGFDHVFICFVLEHLPRPEEALAVARRMLRLGGTLTVIEGDHGSAYFHPRNALAQRTIDCLVEVQRAAGGDALIGRQLYPLLTGAGFQRVKVSPRTVYVDRSRPDLEEGFTRNTFTAMVEGVRDQVISTNMMAADEWDEGVRGLYRTAEGGTFLYTFFKGTGIR